MKSITGGRGVDLAFGPDAANARGLKTVKSIRPFRRALTGSPRHSARGGIGFTCTADRAELQRAAKAVIEGIQGGWLRIDQGKAYPLDEAAQGYRDIEGRGEEGKL